MKQTVTLRLDSEQRKFLAKDIEHELQEKSGEHYRKVLGLVEKMLKSYRRLVDGNAAVIGELLTLDEENSALLKLMGISKEDVKLKGAVQAVLKR